MSNRYKSVDTRRQTSVIYSSDISIVIQGPVLGDGLTKKCLESIRYFFPEAELILSTWNGEDTVGLNYDMLVLNDDPGAEIFHKRLPVRYNLNRQIVSTRAGLLKASRPYVIKTRSDLLFTGNAFLDYWRKYPCRDTAIHIFKDRVINCTVFAQNPRRHQPTPFHPSDWFFFGNRDDLLLLWDLPLAPEPDSSRWFENHARPCPDIYPHLLHRYFPEQYIWKTLLNKFGMYKLEHLWDISEENIRDTELSFANNLILLSPDQIGIRSLKHRLSIDDWGSIYTHAEWERLYRDYCDPKHVVAFDWETCAKDMYQVFSAVAPKRLLDRTLAALLRNNTTSLDIWEKSSPSTFQLAKKIYSWFC